jgi:adenylosuccinate synthase
VLEDRSVAERWLSAIAPLSASGAIVPDDTLRAALKDVRPVVLEGAQGVLLDEARGFHPHTTWSRCTPDAALALLAQFGFEDRVERIGVVRTYLTRHGEGPFPTEDRAMAVRLPEPHNGGDGWQGAFRVGWPDLVLLRYARDVSGGIDSLAVTHADRLERFDHWKAAHAYKSVSEDGLVDRDASGEAVRLRAGDLAHQARLARALAHAEPAYVPIPREPETFVSWLEDELEIPVRLVSNGPTARDKQTRD